MIFFGDFSYEMKKNDISEYDSYLKYISRMFEIYFFIDVQNTMQLSTFPLGLFISIFIFSVCSLIELMIALATVSKFSDPFMSNTRNNSSPPKSWAIALNSLTMISWNVLICKTTYSRQSSANLLKISTICGPFLSLLFRGVHQANPSQNPRGGASP